MGGDCKKKQKARAFEREKHLKGKAFERERQAHVERARFRDRNLADGEGVCGGGTVRKMKHEKMNGIVTVCINNHWRDRSSTQPS